MGIINRCSPYIRNLSDKVAFIKDKLKREAKIIWNVTDDQKLTKLKNPDFSMDFQLETNASDVGVRGVFLQENNILDYLAENTLSSRS